MEDGKKKSSKKRNIIIGIIFIIVILCIVVIALPSPSKESTTETTDTEKVAEQVATNTPEPTETEETKDTPEPIEKIKSLVINVLGSSNRDVPRLSDLIWDEASSEIVVTFAGQDNLTDSMITTGIQMDITDILNVIYNSNTPIPYNNICVVATFPLVDKYGNASEENVVIATYSRETLEKINWENFLTDNIFMISDQDTLFLHPAINQ
jgi:hypothetical protein